MTMPWKPQSRRTPLLAAALAMAVAGALTAGPHAVASSPSTAARHGSTGVPDATMYMISVRAADADGAELAGRLDAAGFDVVARRGSTVAVLGSAATAERLSRLPGSSLVGRTAAAPSGPVPPAPANQDNILPRKLHDNTYPTFYGGYRTVRGFNKFERDLAAAYPRLVKKVTYGRSFTGDNPLNAVCVTVGAGKGCSLTPNVDKPRFLVMSQIHAREIATSETSWRYLTRLVDGYKKDPQITSLLRSSEIWVVPQVNPDGVITVQDGITDHGTGYDSPAWHRKNMDADQAPPGGCNGSYYASQIGVDLNRNNDYHWGGQGTSQNPCDQQFLGRSADSETETTALQGLFGELFKDQRGSGANDPAPPTTTGAMVTIHSVAGLVLLPWSYDATVKAPNDAGLRSMAFRQSFYNGYRTGQSGEVLYNAAGTSDDWSYATLGIASFTWELDGSSGSCEGTFFPLYSCMNAYEHTNLPGLMYDAAAARTPYQLSLGPTILVAKTKASADSVKVTAKADDNAYGTSGVGRPAAQRVTAARIYLDAAPWAGGTPQAMDIRGSGTSVTASVTVPRGSARRSRSCRRATPTATGARPKQCGFRGPAPDRSGLSSAYLRRTTKGPGCP